MESVSEESQSNFGEEEEITLSMSTAETINSFIHPKLKEDFMFIDSMNQITVEENGKDIQLGIKISITPTDGEMSEIHIELTREDDIYYLSRCIISADTFASFKKSQHLRKTETMATFLSNFINVLKNISSNRTSFHAVFDGSKLMIKQQLELKNVTIFSLIFEEIDRSDQYVRDQAQFRFIEKQHLFMQQKDLLDDFIKHVQNHNPQLAQQLKRISKYATK
ncbi:hypothetical protein GPJ56_007494 [Histomonas meleagridis]|uniref:uncharacterized protein n=1 Tax=Histomonas meleagridis TaxID=135588 RepID=UPI00355A0BFF|nr:hypothetical protein GPJ56_007494 [Histomonas meleagridis]KAH0804340.1 hypothetical protein GO595_003170 [Histomonas meleagridis]